MKVKLCSYNGHRHVILSGMKVALALYLMCFSGFGWIKNLTLPDETLLIPFLVGMSLFLNNEINTNRYKPDFIDKGNRIKLKFESLRVVFISQSLY